MKKRRNIKCTLMYLIMIPTLLCLIGCGGSGDVVFIPEEIVENEQMSGVLTAESDEQMSGVSAAESNEQISEASAAESDGQMSETVSTVTDAQWIQVYICGAVVHPGVYTLSEGSRLNDAVLAAGGFTEGAEESSVNLAAKIADEDMIYVYSKEQMVAGEYVPMLPSSLQESGLVNINTADLNTLCTLPGIGESRARDIITYREKNGAFQKKEDIMQVSGIKESLYQRICDLISVK